MRAIGEGLLLVAALALAGWAGRAAPSAPPVTSAPPGGSGPASMESSPHTEGSTVALAGAAGSSGPGGGFPRGCSAVVARLDAQLGVLDERLSVGLSLDAYSTRLGPARLAYAGTVAGAEAAGRIGHRCATEVVAPLGSALSTYVAAYQSWRDCVEATRCTFDRAPAGTADTSWSRAHALLARADASLGTLRHQAQHPEDLRLLRWGGGRRW